MHFPSHSGTVNAACPSSFGVGLVAEAELGWFAHGGCCVLLLGLASDGAWHECGQRGLLTPNFCPTTTRVVTDFVTFCLSH